MESSITYLLWLLDKEDNQELADAIQGLRIYVFKYPDPMVAFEFRRYSAKLMKIIKKMK